MEKRKQKPRICLLIGFFLPNYSGASLQAFRLLKNLQNNNIRSFVITIKRAKLSPFEVIDDIPVHRIDGPDGKWTVRGTLKFWWALFLKLYRMRNQYDIIHIIGAHLQLSIAGPVARLLGKKSIVKLTLARSDLDKLGEGRWGRLQKYCLDRVDRYISISHEITDELRASPLSNQKVIEIPNGVDTDIFHPSKSEVERLAARKYFSLNGELTAGYIGILNQRKGIDLLVEAWRRIKQQNCPGQLLLIGPEENTEPEYFADNIKKKVEQYDLTDSIIFWGPEENVPELLRSCDLLILASRSEGLPNVVLEAMASGLPTLVSDTAGAETVIDDGQNGSIFHNDDPEDFSKQLMNLLKNKPLREKLGLAARSRIEAEFSMNRIGKRYRKLYDSL